METNYAYFHIITPISQEMVVIDGCKWNWWKG